MGTKFTEEKKCCHEEIKRGPDIPLMYGSYQSRICQQCSMWMVVDHHGDPHPRITTTSSTFWRDSDTLDAATKDIELA